jgi:hypothetical protein
MAGDKHSAIIKETNNMRMKGHSGIALNSWKRRKKLIGVKNIIATQFIFSSFLTTFLFFFISLSFPGHLALPVGLPEMLRIALPAGENVKKLF